MWVANNSIFEQNRSRFPAAEVNKDILILDLSEVRSVRRKWPKNCSIAGLISGSKPALNPGFQVPLREGKNW